MKDFSLKKFELKNVQSIDEILNYNNFLYFLCVYENVLKAISSKQHDKTYQINDDTKKIVFQYYSDFRIRCNNNSFEIGEKTNEGCIGFVEYIDNEITKEKVISLKLEISRAYQDYFAGTIEVENKGDCIYFGISLKGIKNSWIVNLDWELLC